MADITDYTGLVTSEHKPRPKFMATVAALAQPFVDLQNFYESLPDAFDLDKAIGVQLDAVGMWVGISRKVATPLTNVYFSLDTPGLGLDEGSLKGPFDPDAGITSLDDDTYRLLLRAKIAANSWDGTIPSAAAILNSLFQNITIFIQDNQDMTMTMGISGNLPSAVFLALFTGGYLPLKPAGVLVTRYVTSQSGAPIFGLDVQNQYIAGLDTGALATLV